MSRLIDADRLKVVLEKNFGHTGGASVLEQLINVQPTIDPVKHGRWVMQGTAYGCSLCGESVIHPFHNYCPNCGAEMEVFGAKKL